MKKTVLTLVALLMAMTTLAQRTAIILAHRGGGTEQEENVLKTFQHSYEAGINSFETDVRMTKDGVLVISHDSSLERTCGIEGTIERMTAKELRKVKTKQGSPLLFLEDLLDFLKDKPHLYVEFEMKTDDKVKETGAFLYEGERLEEYCNKMYEQCKAKMPKDADWTLTSFDHKPLQKIHAQHPEAVLGLITSEGCTEETVKLCKQLGVRRLAALLDKSSRKGVKTAHVNRINVNLWPGSKFSDALLAMYLGADYICTDVPMGAMEYLKKNPPGRPYRF